jgi:hypothetical protein
VPEQLAALIGAKLKIATAATAHASVRPIHRFLEDMESPSQLRASLFWH